MHKTSKNEETLFLNKKTFRSTVKGLAEEEATFRAHIDSRGRIVIPKEERDALGIEDNILLRCIIRKVALTEDEHTRKGKK